ncbi:unnamed protein product [Amoebophrya sp. A25]|nr:unnamed protein product [Amoebophrya sp. A25]|eukprot:GSA25T00009660001.1
MSAAHPTSAGSPGSEQQVSSPRQPSRLPQRAINPAWYPYSVATGVLPASDGRVYHVRAKGPPIEVVDHAPENSGPRALEGGPEGEGQPPAYSPILFERGPLEKLDSTTRNFILNRPVLAEFDWTPPDAMQRGAQWAADQEDLFNGIVPAYPADPAPKAPPPTGGVSDVLEDVSETYGITNDVQDMRLTDAHKNVYQVKPIVAGEVWCLAWTPGQLDTIATTTMRVYGGTIPGKDTLNRGSGKMSVAVKKTLKKGDFEIVRHAFAQCLGTAVDRRNEVEAGTDVPCGKVRISVVETDKTILGKSYADKTIMLDEKSQDASKMLALLHKMMQASPLLRT